MKQKLHTVIHVMLTAVLSILYMVLPVYAADTPQTGDEGLSGLMIPILIGVVLVLVFVVLSVIQKKRRKNQNDDE